MNTYTPLIALIVLAMIALMVLADEFQHFEWEATGEWP